MAANTDNGETRAHDEMLAAVLMAGSLSCPNTNPPSASTLANWIATVKEAATIAESARVD